MTLHPGPLHNQGLSGALGRIVGAKEGFPGPGDLEPFRKSPLGSIVRQGSQVCSDQGHRQIRRDGLLKSRLGRLFLLLTA
jgi:hypothetical protein